MLFRGFFTGLFSHSPLVAQGTGFFFLTLPVVLYFCLMEASAHQATWGKRKMGLRVTDEKGFRIAVLRSQNLYDIAAGTIVWEKGEYNDV